jgi:hypothetical protein
MSKKKPATKKKPQSRAMKAALEAVAKLPAKKETKLAALVTLLERPEGATIEDMIIATSWQKHTIRAALSHALGKKRGYKITSEKPEGGIRAYRIEGGKK